jgi:hypothetical protein
MITGGRGNMIINLLAVSSFVAAHILIGMVGMNQMTPTAATPISSQRDIIDDDVDVDVYHVPSFTKQELLAFFKHNMDDESSLLLEKKENDFYNSVSTRGLIAIRMDEAESDSKTPSEKNNNDGDLRSDGFYNDEYEDSRRVALSGLCLCAVQEDYQDDKRHTDNEEPLFRTVVGPQTQNRDGFRISRTTFATATVSTNLPMRIPFTNLTDSCGIKVAQAMESLRESVADASTVFISAIDNLLVKSTSFLPSEDETIQRFRGQQGIPLLHTSAGDTFDTLASIVQSSTHLEHFHVYRKYNSTSVPSTATTTADGFSSTSSNNLILDVHTDAGLFLAFAPGFNCHSDVAESSTASSWKNSGLYVQDSTRGNLQVSSPLKRAIFPRNSVGILIGIGMQNWIQTSSPKISTSSDSHPFGNKKIYFHATPHAVYMPTGTAGRSWYGKSKFWFENMFANETQLKFLLF